jgi:hypothetical protein
MVNVSHFYSLFLPFFQPKIFSHSFPVKTGLSGDFTDAKAM